MLTAAAAAQAGVSVQEADFDLGEEVAALRAGDLGVGAVASFVGTVRQWSDSGTAPADDRPVLVLEHYPGMTEQRLETMVAQARQRFDVRGIRLIHRFGPLSLGDQIVLVAVTSAHRGEAFQCCEFLMDWLKTDAPFWKKECSLAGDRWVEARTADDQALDRWSRPASSPEGAQP